MNTNGKVWDVMVLIEIKWVSVGCHGADWENWRSIGSHGAYWKQLA
jgi:hypothetical protein